MTTQLPNKESIEDAIEGLEQLINRGTQSVYLDVAIAGLRALLAAYEQEPVAENLRIADALESLLWPNMALGNKAVIQAAIDALRTHPAPSIPEGLLIAWWDSTAPDGFRWKEGVLRNSMPDGTPVFAASVAPSIPAAPDALQEFESEDGTDIDYMRPSHVYKTGKVDGWNACRAAMLNGGKS